MSNGSINKTAKRKVKYMKPISLHETNPIKYASLKSSIEEQSIFFFPLLVEHNCLTYMLCLSIWFTNKSMDVVKPTKIAKRNK